MAQPPFGEVGYEEQQIDGEVPLVFASISPAHVGDRECPRYRAQGASVRSDRRQTTVRFSCRAVVGVGGLGRFAVASDVRGDVQDVKGRLNRSRTAQPTVANRRRTPLRYQMMQRPCPPADAARYEEVPPARRVRLAPVQHAKVGAPSSGPRGRGTAQPVRFLDPRHEDASTSPRRRSTLA